MNIPQFLAEIEGSDVPHIDAGDVIGKLEGIEKTTTRFGNALKFYWVVPDGRGGTFQLTQMTSTATSGGSNAGRNVRVLRGRGLAPGERLPVSEIVGESALLTVSVNPEAGWNRVEDVQPLPNAVVAAPAPAGSAQAMIDRLAAEAAAPDEPGF